MGSMPASCIAQHFTPSKKSSVEYRVYAHKDGTALYRGLFPDIKGDIFFYPKQLGKSSFDIRLAASGVNSSSSGRDKMLRAPQYLAASMYPEIRIKSSSITADGNSGIIYILHGNLTVKGTTKPVNIQFTATPTPDGYLFRGSFQINRLDYKVGEKGDIDNLVTIFVELRTDRK
jgi:polyisoprenoid-binding protein YceI